MAYINDPGGGRSGPYWRRQMGTTLPGERTGAQLQLINLARQRLGLPPIGGPGPGRPANPVDGPQRPGPPPLRQANPGMPHERFPEPSLRTAEPGMPHERFPAPTLRQANPVGGGPTFGQGMNEFDPNAGVDPMAGEPGAAPPGMVGGEGSVAVDGNDETDLAQLRNQILNRYHGATQPSYSRDALRNYVQQHMRQRNAVAANQPRRPILPQRRAQKAIPY